MYCSRYMFDGMFDFDVNDEDEVDDTEEEE